MNLLKTTKRSTMGNELLRILMTVCSLGKDAGWDDPTKIPIEDIIELWREQSSKGEYANSLYWGAAWACWTRWPPPRTLERLRHEAANETVPWHQAAHAAASGWP